MDELEAIRKLAGVQPAPSQGGSNISITGSEKHRIERERNINPGTREWFKLWFARPYLTGEQPVSDGNVTKGK